MAALAALAVAAADVETHTKAFLALESADGKISGSRARELWRKSGIDDAVLSQVWSRADLDADGKLNAEEFVIGMVIVTRLNTGEYASADDIPVFAGAPATSAAAATPSACAEAEVAVPDANMCTKLSALFVKFDGSTGPGTLSSAKVMNLLKKSKLPEDQLETIWRLSDQLERGRLNRREFITAMHLATLCKRGQTLPIRLPATFASWDWVVPEASERETEAEAAAWALKVSPPATPTTGTAVHRGVLDTPPPAPLETPPPVPSSPDGVVSPMPSVPSMPSLVEETEAASAALAALAANFKKLATPSPCATAAPAAMSGPPGPVRPGARLSFAEHESEVIYTHHPSDYDRSNPDLDLEKNVLAVQFEQDFERERERLSGQRQEFDAEMAQLRIEEERRESAQASGAGQSQPPPLRKVADVLAEFVAESGRTGMSPLAQDLANIRAAKSLMRPSPEQRELDDMRDACIVSIEDAVDETRRDRAEHQKSLANFVGRRKNLSELITALLDVEPDVAEEKGTGILPLPLDPVNLAAALESVAAPLALTTKTNATTATADGLPSPGAPAASDDTGPPPQAPLASNQQRRRSRAELEEARRKTLFGSDSDSGEATGAEPAAPPPPPVSNPFAAPLGDSARRSM